MFTSVYSIGLILSLLKWALSASIERTNLLLIMFDDLRPELSIYGRNFMHTPNFERIARKSVVFDYAYAQVAVCNPSRDSLLTGLRPDSVGTYAFQSTYEPHLILPSHLTRLGYKTAGYGKILHWEDDVNHGVWSHESFQNSWYEYQAQESNIMNSSVMPDRKNETEFRDYIFASKAIDGLKKLAASGPYFMMSVGFKLPHLALHVPYRHYAMYRNKTEEWQLSKRELRYSFSAPSVGYRCCGGDFFVFMEEEGSVRSKKRARIGNINAPFTEKMHDELMMGYCGGVSFMDEQVGRILDAIDELKLWNNITIVITSDHGMHNGEKGLWEKWTLFEESTRVPLIIYHPQSPFKGQRYSYPVELIDIYPTIVDLLSLPSHYDDPKVCRQGTICRHLQGKSLVPAILGKHIQPWSLFNFYWKSSSTSYDSTIMPKLHRDYAITQMWRCAPKESVLEEIAAKKLMVPGQKLTRKSIWTDCHRKEWKDNELSIMGYSMRTPEYRYNLWCHFDPKVMKPNLSPGPFAEELYDHRNETLSNFTHTETVNLAHWPQYQSTLMRLRSSLYSLINKEFVYRGPFE